MRALWAPLLVALLLAAGPLRAEPTRPEIVTSPGGITAWLISEPSIPLISMRFSFEGGGALDPAGKEGLANLVTALLDEGAGKLDSLAFQTRIEELAVKLGFDADRDRFYGRFSTLTRNLDQGVELLQLALTAPRFDAAAVERMRRQIIVGLTQDLESPHVIAGRHWFKQIFGQHPYWHSTEGTVEGVRAIGRDDLARFVAERFARDNLRVAVVGDITAEALGPILDRVFGGLPATSKAAAVPAATPTFTGGVEVLRRQTPQSAIFFGLPGLKRDDPDWYVAHLLSTVLGGGTQSSRLYEEVRERRGLAYTVYSYLQPMDAAGLLLGGAGTRNGKVAETLKVIRSVLMRIGTEGITAKELNDARLYINGSFPLGLTSSDSIAQLLLAMQVHHLGPDYVERRPQMYDRITLEDVRRVAKRLLKPELLQVVIVGDPAGLD
jgi:zinc protease